MGFGHPGHQTSSGKMSPFLLIIPEITPSFMKKQKCDCTCAWEGGEKGKGTELQAKKYLILQLLYCFHSTWFFGLAIKSEGFTLSEDLALNFSSELSLLAPCQNKYVLGIWQGKEPRLQVHGIFFCLLVICLLVFLSFFWKGLVVFIYCKQVGKAYKRSSVQQALVSGRLAALFEYLSFV